jgi:hypothetical protein
MGESRNEFRRPVMKDWIAIVVPVAFFLSLLGGVAVTLYFRARREHERHETLRKMVEKGQEIPSALLIPPQLPASDLRRGLVLLGSGIGVTVMLMGTDDHDLRSLWGAGLIPTLMGVAYLITWWIARREVTAQGPEGAAPLV